MNIFRIAFFILLSSSVLELNAKNNSSDLKHWPKGSSPAEVGKRIVVKFLNTPHSSYGNTHPYTPPVQITYPDVCAWLGGLWFSRITHDQKLFEGLESRFAPLFDSQKNLLPKPNHVDNNVFVRPNNQKTLIWGYAMPMNNGNFRRMPNQQIRFGPIRAFLGRQGYGLMICS